MSLFTSIWSLGALEQHVAAILIIDGLGLQVGQHLVCLANGVELGQVRVHVVGVLQRVELEGELLETTQGHKLVIFTVDNRHLTGIISAILPGKPFSYAVEIYSSVELRVILSAS